ncbi:MAG TPA: hypothetical protein VMR98_06280 [Candidatus Polarisedimenticolaceae bacterium]|nr:hypothetical protein [Candidatus Polarisedimenticolaceae bacterium]
MLISAKKPSLILVAVVAIVAAIAGIYIVLSSRAATATCSSVSQYGITWTFDKTYPCGQFANGDWWVAPSAGEVNVKVTGMTPAYAGGQNGWEVNPGYGDDFQGKGCNLPTAKLKEKQGLDQNIGCFDANLIPNPKSPSAASPYLALPGESIVKATTANDGGSCPTISAVCKLRRS